MMLSDSYHENLTRISERLDLPHNFDLIDRLMTVGGKNACLFFLDGFTQDEILFRIVQSLRTVKPEEMPATAEDFCSLFIDYGETSASADEDFLITSLLSGQTLLLLDGYEKGILIDCRTYPARKVGEPEKDKVLRGSRDGFVETLVFNTALIRRRIRSTHFKIQCLTVGDSSHTDVAVCYMDSRVDHALLERILFRIRHLKTDALTMNQESLAECLFPHRWFNPFPKFRFSERPDTAAASILEGSIVILVDNSPAAMILPSSIFDMIEDADDYYFPPMIGSYLRLSKLFVTFVTLFLTPVWLLLVKNPQMVPPCLSFVIPEGKPNIPYLFQLLILESAIDGLKLAAVNTPSMLGTPLSIVAGIVLGEYSVKSGWFSSETMLYMAFVTIANYSQSSFEMGYALKFMRIILLLLTALFGTPGFVIGTIFVCLCIGFNRTIAGKSYLYPLIPFSFSELRKRIFRTRLPHEREEES